MGNCKPSSPGTGYLLTKQVLANEYNAISLVIGFWTHEVPQWGWILIFWSLFLVLSNLGVLAYGEMEFWLSLYVPSRLLDKLTPTGSKCWPSSSSSFSQSASVQAESDRSQSDSGTGTTPARLQIQSTVSPKHLSLLERCMRERKCKILISVPRHH